MDTIKVIDLTYNSLLDIILKEVAFAYGVIEIVNDEKGVSWVEVCGYDGHKREDETEQEYEDRIYTDAHDAVMSAVEEIEDCDHFDFEGLEPDNNDGVEWYDEVREEAIRVVTEWFTNGQMSDED